MIDKTADFSFIRYANVWEDPRVLLEGIFIKQGSRYLSVGSAGDNTFSLLMLNPELVVAVDISPVQLYLIELKIAAISELDQPEVLSFLGFNSSTVRKQTFDKIKFRMSEDARHFFELNLSQWAENGIIHSGKFERYFQYFSKYVLPLIHGSKRIEKLFQPKTDKEQKDFFETKWNSWRWKTLFRVFFSKTVMGKLGRDPQFLKEVNVTVSEFILTQAQRQLSSVYAQTNPFLRYNLTGSFDDLIPHYLQPGNFETIKSRLSRVKLHLGYAEDAIQHFGPFDGMNLSNIFEYMSVDIFKNTTLNLTKGLNLGGRLVYWNLMVDRRCSKVRTDFGLKEQQQLMEGLKAKDWGYFYKTVVVDEKVVDQTEQPSPKEKKIQEKEIHFSNDKASVIVFINPKIEQGKTAILGNYHCESKDNDGKFGEQVLESALLWCKEQGFESVIGPMNGNTWDTYRYKIKGNRNFLGDLPMNIEWFNQWKNMGFQVEARYVSTQVRESKFDRFELRKNQLESGGLVFRNLVLVNWEAELEKVYKLSLVAFKSNAFYTEIDWLEFKANYDAIKNRLDPNWILFAEDQNSGELVGFVFAYLDQMNDPSSLIIKTVARKDGFRWSGLGLVMTQILQQKAEQMGINEFIHAFMHEKAVSLNCSSSMQAEVISEYVLMRKYL